MKFARLILAAFTRNPLRSFFTFAAVAAAFCLFGVLETVRYQRDTPSADEDLIVVQPDGATSLPRSYEDIVLAMPGVKAATALAGIPAVHPKSPTDTLIVFGVNAAQAPALFSGMKIAPEVAARWQQTRTGFISDERTARELGWRVNDTVTVRLTPGAISASGKDHFELILVGTYAGKSVLNGVMVRDDYLRAAFPQNERISNLFVRPELASQTHALAQRIDERFRSGPDQTLSAPIYDFRQSSAKDAATVRLVILGALAISFFTMVLIVANAMTQSVRERLGEMAVMQALGFQERTILILVYVEAIALFATGAVVGLILANVGFALEVAGTRSNSAVLPAHTVLSAAAYVVVCASIAALLPWWELSRLRVSDALRRL
jgi:putative ABC transport system permease protein